MSFAKKMGLYAVCTESTEQVAQWEAAAKEFDIKVAFHEHGTRLTKDGKIDPKYKVWDPLYILGVVESRDARIGACADIGHWAHFEPEAPSGRSRSSKDASSACTSRISPTSASKATVVVAGKGVVDVDGLPRRTQAPEVRRPYLRRARSRLEGQRPAGEA
jgi:hypothetical protein